MPGAVAILNPKAAGGKVRRRWPAFEAAIRERIPDLQVRWTERPWHAAEITKEVLLAGTDLVIAAGGDGTVHEVVNGFFENDAPVRPGARLAYVPMGTGADFQRTVQAPSNPTEVAAYLAAGHSKAIDVGLVRFLDSQGREIRRRYFANLLSFGMGGDVSIAAKETLICKLDGKAAFLWGTLKVFLRYRGKRVRLVLDDGETLEGLDITNVAVGNGEYHGGGMHPCPRASLVDGMLEVTIIDRLTTWELLRDISTLYSDDIYKHPKVRHRRTRGLKAYSPDETRAEVDGEAAGSLPLEIRVLPGALPLMRPKDSEFR